MVLLRTCYRYTRASFNIISNCNLVRFGVYMVKLYFEKVLIFNMSSPLNTELYS